MYRASNPFSTRFTQPGRIESLDGTGCPVDVGELLDRLGRLGGTAAVVGPHGSGKSTLLVHLSAEIEKRGGCAPRMRLRSWRDMPSIWRTIRRVPIGATVCIDSWECLGPVARRLLRLVARISRRGLLVTAHHACGLPVLSRRYTSAALLHAIVARLPDQATWRGRLIGPVDVEGAFARHGGNLRESLCELYDRFEARARRPSAEGDGDDPAAGDGRAGGRLEIHESVGGFSCAGAPERNLG